MRILTCLCVVSSLLGQNAANRRVPAPPPARSDYAAAAAVLQAGAPAPPEAKGGSGAPPVPRPKPDVPLTPSEQQAVRASASWRAEANVPAPGPDGRVVYSFGAGLPTGCAPLCGCASSSFKPAKGSSVSHRSAIPFAGTSLRRCTALARTRLR